MPSAGQTVAIDRAETFPSLEQLLKDVGGGDIIGLLGIDALGHKQVVISSSSLAFVP